MEDWKKFFSLKGRPVMFAILAFTSISVVCIFSRFMVWNEGRQGVHFDDPVLRLFLPVNISILTSLCTLIPILTGLFFIFQKPTRTVYFLFASINICLLRMLSLYFVVLEPPALIIPLTDPVIEILFYGGEVLLKDLFFSGHTANLILVGMLVDVPWVKKFLFFFGLVVGILVVMQHVHYSIDVVAAPFFAYAAYKISIFTGDKWLKSDFISKNKPARIPIF